MSLIRHGYRRATFPQGKALAGKQMNYHDLFTNSLYFSLQVCYNTVNWFFIAI